MYKIKIIVIKNTGKYIFNSINWEESEYYPCLSLAYLLSCSNFVTKTIQIYWFYRRLANKKDYFIKILPLFSNITLFILFLNKANIPIGK